MICQLGLNQDVPPTSCASTRLGNVSGTTTEVFDDAMQAFRRHAAIELVLVDEGWLLESFESVIGATLAKVSAGG